MMKLKKINTMKLLFSTFLIIFFCNTYAQINIDDHLKAVDFVFDGRMKLIGGDQDEAIIKLKNAIMLDSTIREAYIFLNHALLETNKIEEQIENLKSAKIIFKDDDEFCYYLGKVYQSKNEYDKAISEYSDAIKYSKINGEDFEIVYSYYESRGTCFLKKKMYSKSLADYDYALKLNSSESSIYANKGFALYKLKKTKEACKSWKISLKLGESQMNKYISKYCN